MLAAEGRDLEELELTDFSHLIPADQFTLDLGIALWDDDEQGPVVGLARVSTDRPRELGAVVERDASVVADRKSVV